MQLYYLYNVDKMSETKSRTVLNSAARTIISPWTKTSAIVSPALSSSSFFIQGIMAQISTLMQNPIMDMLIGGSAILLFGSIYKSAFDSHAQNNMSKFLSQSVYAWFVILFILYVVVRYMQW